MTSNNDITDGVTQNSQEFEVEALRDMLNHELPAGAPPITTEDVIKIIESAAQNPDSVNDTLGNSAEQSAREEDLSVAPEHINLPARYRDTETRSMADDPVWADHLTQHWGF